MYYHYATRTMTTFVILLIFLEACFTFAGPSNEKRHLNKKCSLKTSIKPCEKKKKSFTQVFDRKPNIFLIRFKLFRLLLFENSAKTTNIPSMPHLLMRRKHNKACFLSMQGSPNRLCARTHAPINPVPATERCLPCCVCRWGVRGISSDAVWLLLSETPEILINNE